MINYCYFQVQRPQNTQGLASFDLQCPTDRYFFDTGIVKKTRFLAKTVGLNTPSFWRGSYVIGSTCKFGAEMMIFDDFLKICSNYHKWSSKVCRSTLGVQRSYFRQQIIFLDTSGQMIGHNANHQKSAKIAKITILTKNSNFLKVTGSVRKWIYAR